MSSETANARRNQRTAVRDVERMLEEDDVDRLLEICESQNRFDRDVEINNQNEPYRNKEDSRRSIGSGLVEEREDFPLFNVGLRNFDNLSGNSSENSTFQEITELSTELQCFSDTSVNVKELLDLLEVEEMKRKKIPDDQRDLVHFCIKNCLGRRTTDELLEFLRKHYNPNLPKSGKALLKTPRNTTKLITQLGNGFFWYYGIMNAMQQHLSKKYLEDKSIVEIDVFVDGVSPYKSVRISLWPIVGCLVGTKKPFIIAIWCGASKEPQDLNGYLKDFVAEVMEMKENFLFQDQQYKLNVRRYIADAPARAWLRQVNQHNSYNSCERCDVRGEWLGRMTYCPKTIGALRRDETFALHADARYHLGLSPLAAVGVKMISQFPLEPMHLLYLGVMKRLLSVWLIPKKSKHKLRNQVVENLSTHMISLAPHFPSEFARKPRSLKEWKMFKATEYRRILLYDGIVVFKKLSKEVYSNFLLFSVAVRILADPDMKQFFSDADTLLKIFVEEAGSERLYTQRFVVYNVHHLLHFASDCMLHGALEDFSAFKYENFLGSLKNLLRAPGRSLSQIVCRIMEQVNLFNNDDNDFRELTLSQEHYNGPLLGLCGQQFRKLEHPSMLLKLTPNDSCVKLKNDDVVVVQNIVRSQDNTVCIVGRAFQKKENYFTYPLDSSLIGIFLVSIFNNISKWPFEQVKRKCVLLPIANERQKDSESIQSNNKFLCIPLIHEF